MKKKMSFVAVAAAVFAFATLSVLHSYSRYGKKVSENTAGTADGKIFLCRRFAEISKVIAIDSRRKSHKKEATLWEFDAAKNVLTVAEKFPDFASPVFHIEGKAAEPAEFFLRECDFSKGPVGVFVNGKAAAENRDYVLDKTKKILTMKISAKEISSIAIQWNTLEGLASISEMSQKESDLYAELQGMWLAENAKNEIASQTENAVLEFGGDLQTPRVVMKKIGDEEKQKMLDEFPVNAYKFRRNANPKRLSKEAGIKINLPKKVGEYKIISALLIESAVKGEKTKSADLTYDKGDFFCADSISVEMFDAETFAAKKLQEIEYPISQEILQMKIPVQKQICWAIACKKENGAMTYMPQKLCVYTWQDGGTAYRIQCDEGKAAEVEDFIKSIN